MDHRGAAAIRALAALALVVAFTGTGAARAVTGSPTRGASPPAATGGAVPRLDTSTCPFLLPPDQVLGQTADCGFLVVPERHADPTGPTVRLAVIRYRNRLHRPDPDPIVYLKGGPGPVASNFGISYIATHDVLLFDQRGVSPSTPSLDCPEVKSQMARDATQILTPEVEERHEVTAAVQCRDRLVAAGVDLAAFTDAESAADVSDLRAVFGYRQVDLLGVSYGTRLALEVMRDYPQIVHRVVLDSVLPPQAPVLADAAVNFDRALRQDFADCVASRACTVSVATLETDFAQAVNRLNAQPARVTTLSRVTRQTATLVITGDRLVTLLQDWLYTSQPTSLVPALLTQLARGDTTLLVPLVQRTFFAQPRFTASLGAALAVYCGELVAAPQAPAATATPAPPPPIRGSQVGIGLLPASVCAQWPVAADRRTRQPVRSAAPTLLLAGDNDPITPPAFARLAAQTLSQSRVIAVPGFAHAVTSTPCGATLANQFFTQPATNPATGCLATLRVSYVPAT